MPRTASHPWGPGLPSGAHAYLAADMGRWSVGCRIRHADRQPAAAVRDEVGLVLADPDGDARLTGGKAFLMTYFLAPFALALTIFPLLGRFGADVAW